MLGVDLYYTAELRPARIGTWPFGIIGDSGPISGIRKMLKQVKRLCIPGSKQDC